MTRQPDEMYCTSCGAVIQAGVQFCPQCGARAGAGPGAVPPPGGQYVGQPVPKEDVAGVGRYLLNILLGGLIIGPLLTYFLRKRGWLATWILLGIDAVIVVLIIIAAAAGGGGDEEGQPVAQAQPSPTAPAAAESPTAEAPAEEVQETPEEQETPEPPAIERIVAAEIGAVAEAEGVRITLNDIIDPWISPAEFALDEPEPGKRFVAFDVTIEWVKDSGTHFACWTDFKLSDADAFVYEYELLFDLEPLLDCTELGGGQKTRGWIGFQVNEAAPLDLLKYDPNIFTTNDIEFQFE